MLNDNKISEIKIIIEGLLNDVESLTENEMISHLKWEEILMSASLVSHKLNTLRIEQERNNLKRYYLKEDAINQFDSNDNEFKRLNHTISQLKKEMSEIRLNFAKSLFIDEAPLQWNKGEQERLQSDETVPVQPSAEPVQPQTEPVQPQTETSLTEQEKVESNEMQKQLFEPQIETNELQTKPGQSPIEPVRSQTEPLAQQINNESGTINFEENELDFLLDKRSLMDIPVSYKSEPEWMKDMPGQPVDDLRMAVTLNDKLFFIRELFKGDEDQYRLSMQKLNDFDSFTQALQYTREAFEEWDEGSDAAYRFFMILRRRYNG